MVIFAYLIINLIFMLDGGKKGGGCCGFDGGKKGGGCWPGYLPNKIQGENLIIEIKDLEAGKFRFQ